MPGVGANFFYRRHAGIYSDYRLCQYGQLVGSTCSRRGQTDYGDCSVIPEACLP